MNIEITGSGVDFVKPQTFQKLMSLIFILIMMMLDTVHCLFHARYCAVRTTSLQKLYEIVIVNSCYKWGTKTQEAK